MRDNKNLQVCVVLPTYNEKANIRRTLDAILKQPRLHPHDNFSIQVLVVDDNSPDNTAGVVERYRERHPQVHLLLRTAKNGLGAAYIAGMRYAMRTLNPDVIIEMDADGQHDANDIPRLLIEIRRGADFVIGSRYVRGGSVPESWSGSRKLLSKAANTYTRLILNTGGTKDCTGGFRAIKTDVLRTIDLKRLEIKGYAFQVALLNAAVRNGAQVREIPITFGTRTQGESKMGARDLIAGGFSLARIRARQLFGRKEAET